MDESPRPEAPEHDEPVGGSSAATRRTFRQPRVYSVKSFLLELATITAGVLIALSVDSVREWQQHRSLVRQARATIAREIAANRSEVRNTLEGADKRDKQLQKAFAMAHDLLARRPVNTNELTITMLFGEISEAAWLSAERTGALSHMDYAEVQRYSRLYALQDLYESQQRRALERLTAALALFSHGDPTKAPMADVESFRRELLSLGGELGVLDQFGKQLVEGYDNFLKD